MSRMCGKSWNFDVLIDKLLSWFLTSLFNFLFFSLMMMLLGVATSIARMCGMLQERYGINEHYKETMQEKE